MIGVIELIILGFFLIAVILFIVLIFALRSRMESQKDVTFADALPDDDPLVTQGEFQATPIAEVIEERVRQMAAEDPSIDQFDVDFGTGPGGELEIWVNDQRYTSVEDLPQERLREVIREAVENYNKDL